MPQLSTSQTPPPNSADLDAVVEAAVARAYHWMDETAEADANDASTQQLAEMLRDDNGVRFTMEPTTIEGSTLAVFDDTCGNLIQIIEQKA